MTAAKDIQQLLEFDDFPLELLQSVPVPLVPDLSLVFDNNDNAAVKHDKPSVSSQKLFSKVNDNNGILPVVSAIGDNQIKLNENSYLAWRMKNSDLFNKSQNQNCNSGDTVSDIGNRKLVTGRSNLLSRITEISERLERDELNDNVQFVNSGIVSKQDKNDEFYKRIDAVSKNTENENSKYERIKELYDAVFPSEVTRRSVQENANYRVSSNDGTKFMSGDDKAVSVMSEVGRQQDRLEHIHKHNFDEDSMPKKVVSFEQDEVSFSRTFDNGCSCNCVNNQMYNQSCKRMMHYSPPQNQTLPQRHRLGENDHRSDCHYNKTLKDSDSSLPLMSYNKERHVTNSCYRHSQRPAYKSHDSSKSYDDQCRCHECHDEMNRRYLNRNSEHIGNKVRKDSTHSDSSCEENLQTVNKNRKKKKITVDELYKIVKLQNEQINLLQKQIDRLLEQNYNKKESDSRISPESKKSISRNDSVNKTCSCNHNSTSNNHSGQFTANGFTLSVVKENSNIGCGKQNHDNINIDCNDIGLKKNTTNVSIGVMTSFVEITQKMQSLMAQQYHNGAGAMPGDHCNQEMKCNDNVEGNKKKRKDFQQRRSVAENSIKSCPPVTEESFTLNEGDLPVLPAVVDEHVPTPQCSLHLDIQDYGSTTTGTSSCSSDSNSDEQSSTGDNPDEEHQSDDGRVGWTLYDNVVNRINKILHHDGTNQSPNEVNHIPNHDMVNPNDVRSATIQQLKKLGVSFMENDMSASKKVTFDPGDNNQLKHFPISNGRNYNENVNGNSPFQYFNEEQILQAAMNIMKKRKGTETHDSNRYMTNGAGQACGNTDLSFATMKYLERYQLLPGSNREVNNGGDRQQNRSSNHSKKHKKTKKQAQRASTSATSV